MEQEREPRNKPTHLLPVSLLQESQEYKTGKASSATGVGKAGQPHVNRRS